MSRIGKWFRHFADAVAVGLLTAIFLSFILQIVSRYIIQKPLGWTLEASLLGWLWLVFWSSAFTLRESDHVRFTILYDMARPGLKKIYLSITAICIGGALIGAMPATYDFVSFMKIEKTSLLKFRFDHVFGIFLIFSVATVLRYLWRLYNVVRGNDEMLFADEDSGVDGAGRG
ncbi:MAG TPA: TRAP transporter small permease [Devosia sp.]|nr:TRAP transporter small permease [Devosia sp.]